MDAQYYQWGLITVLAMAAIILPVLFFISAPYGRHSRPGWGPVVPAKLGWIVMELPSPLCFAWFYFQGDHSTATAPMILFLMYMAHYSYRAVIYPFQMKGSGKTKPLLTVLMAIFFNVLNGSLNGWAIQR